MGKKCSFTIRLRILVFLGGLLFWTISPLYANEPWTLEKSIERAVAVSHTLKAAKENVKVNRANLEQTKKWPNPSFEIEGSNKLGKQDGRDNYSLTSFAVSQPLPIMRLSSEKSYAFEKVLEEESHLKYEALKVEYDLAQNYHNLQFVKAVFDIAKKKLALVEERLESHNKEGGIVRFLPPLEKSRLNIIKQNASFDLETAEGEYLEAISHIKVGLQIGEDEVFELSDLSPDIEVQNLENLQAEQKKHPLIVAFHHSLEAAKASVKSA
ncbi:MAG: TolC family protein, partial [Candidatus Omnitrophica bacterium]|nr:TolC family protein [Candidatus Omnitrophota bacterium]